MLMAKINFAWLEEHDLRLRQLQLAVMLVHRRADQA